MPPWCLHALRTADAAELSAITLRMLDAQCAAEVFSGGVCRCRGDQVMGGGGGGQALRGRDSACSWPMALRVDG